jgi:hypothetical protein
MESFIARHQYLSTLPDNKSIILYSSNEDTKNGYACITPAGTFLEDIDNKHKYSRCILDVGVDEAWSDIDYRPENFRKRGGYYDWGDDSSNNKSNNVTCNSNVSQDIEDLMNTTNNISKTVTNENTKDDTNMKVIRYTSNNDSNDNNSNIFDINNQLLNENTSNNNQKTYLCKHTILCTTYIGLMWIITAILNKSSNIS